MELIEIGKMGKPFGTEGLLRCFIEAVYQKTFLSSTFLFVKLNGQAVPFFIEGAERDGQVIEVRIEEIEDREAAGVLAGKTIYLRREDLEEISLPTSVDRKAYEQWLGFRLKDVSLGDIGSITAFEELPQQILAVVEYRGQSVMIPFQEALITEKNPSDQTIIMDLPEGLLDL
jgi:16S rRNA processing protein RimM